MNPAKSHLLLNSIQKVSYVQELDRKKLFNVRRYNRGLQIRQDNFNKFPRGAIVKDVKTGYMRYVSEMMTSFQFKDRGIILNNSKMELCNVNSYEIII